jgi:hyperosmotically inducible periplasmic protein
MRSVKVCALSWAFLAAMLIGGCSDSATKSPDVTGQIRQNLDQGGFSSVSVTQDRDKGVVTLTGDVPTEADKAQAETIAKAAAPGQIVSNQIGVRPPGDEGSTAKKVDSALDSGIEKNLNAAFLEHKLNRDVKYNVKNGVVTLTGTVKSTSTRSIAEKVAAKVPNVKQVVNELEIKGQKASSTSG